LTFVINFMSFSFRFPGQFRSGLFILPHFWVGIFILIFPAIYELFVHKHTYYALTNKRVIFQGGLIGRDFRMIDFDKVTNAEVNVNLFDKMFGGDTGSIMISSANTIVLTKNGRADRPYTLCNVLHPYEVFKYFKQVSHDIKTDIEYPNQYRPVENPGYQTQYTPKDPV
jgi:hypothetical protein